MVDITQCGTNSAAITKNFAPISVVVPCYNCFSTIERAVLSVFSQTVSPKEIILIDDGSTDSTRSILHNLSIRYSDRNIVVLESDKNSGASSARNFGWDVATGEFIAFLDADDSWHPQKLYFQYSHMLRRPEIMLSGHACRFLRTRQDKISHKYSEEEFGTFSDVKFDRMLFKNYFQTPSVMIRRGITHRFDERRRHGEDYMLWMEIASEGKLLTYSPTILAFLHKPYYGASGLSAQMWLMERGELSVYWSLYKRGRLGACRAVAASIWSLGKYLRRLIIAKRVA